MRISSVFAKNSKLALCVLALSLTVVSLSAEAQRRVRVAPDETPPKIIVEGEDVVDATPAPVSDAALPPEIDGGGSSSVSTDPCPSPSAEMAQAPDDLAKIQGDIDRYTLCMERAQLLQRLNDVALENQKKLNEANGIGANISGNNPGMQLESLPDFAQQRDQIMASVDAGAVDGAAADVPPPPETNEWLIMKVLGSGTALSAQLGKTDGTLAQVKQGDKLPDGSQVNGVTATSVTITQEGTSKELRWRDDAPGTTGSGS